jgi:CubicO group peptidase (beta-lactamase class C family)
MIARVRRRFWALLPLFVVLLALMANPVHASAAQPGGPQRVTLEQVRAALPQLEQFAQQALDRTGLPGMAIAVVYQDQVVYLQGLGVREAGQQDPVDADTVFQLASMSKPISATVVAALVSDGAVSWDDRVVDHDPEFQLQDPWVTGQVTIRDFFLHRSGLPGTAGNDLEQLGYGRDEILRRLRYLKPASSFRSQYAYSNFGLTEGAIAAAKATGKSWEEVAAEKLYRPLGMSSTSSRFADYEAAPNRARIHVLVDGTWAPKFTRHADAQSPAGGVSSTARDLAQWVRLLLGEGTLEAQQVINPDALAQTHLPQILRGSNLVTEQPAFYGLGWNVDYDEQGRIFWSHAGAFSLGARTEVRLLPAEDLGIVVLANAFPTGVPEAIASSFYDLVLHGTVTRDWIAFWNEPFEALVQSFYAPSRSYATPPAEVAPARPSSAYVGPYANDYFGAIEVSETDGALTLLLGLGRMAFPLRHWDQDVFLYEPDAEFPGAVSGVRFSFGLGQQAQQVVLENFNDNEQGAFTRVLSAG